MVCGVEMLCVRVSVYVYVCESARKRYLPKLCIKNKIKNKIENKIIKIENKIINKIK